jgi:hypothetical protein
VPKVVLAPLARFQAHRTNGRYEIRELENAVEESVHVIIGQHGNQVTLRTDFLNVLVKHGGRRALRPIGVVQSAPN